MKSINRRKLLLIGTGAIVAGGWGSRQREIRSWRGTALGADARILLSGFDKASARRTVAAALGEVERLEKVFSLYRPDSELCRLNRDGALANPSHDFLIVLERALHWWRVSGGAFNPAVQPLWSYLAQHFAGGGRDDPPAGALRRVADLCRPERISWDGGGVRLASGMALTFNGIAQGYITDRVCALLRRRGCRDVLAQLGESRALPGRAWPVTIAGQGRRVELHDAALAVSAPAATPLSADGRWHHLIDANKAAPASGFVEVAVTAADATTADALSTAIAVAGPARAGELARRAGAVKVLARTEGGDDVSL